MPTSSTNGRPIITHSNPKSPISEAYRTLRTSIDFSSVDVPIRTLMLTSAGPGEGKSTTTANVAVAFAQSDRKVLVIDADLRKPTMHHTFHRSNRRGLTTVLAGQVDWQSAVVDTDVPNLDLLPAGPVPPNPSEMLASKRMGELLNQLKEHYDMIVIDTPPALAVADAQIMATRCDGVVLVIQAGKVKKDAALKLKANMDFVKARILGVVLNNVNRKTGEGYYYYYYYGTESENK